MLLSYLHYGKWPPVQLEFMNYINKNNPEVFPTLRHGVGWDAIHLFARAMTKAGNDPAKIRDELEKIKKYPGVLGEYNFSPSDHIPPSPEFMLHVKVQNRRFVLLES